MVDLALERRVGAGFGGLWTSWRVNSSVKLSVGNNTVPDASVRLPVEIHLFLPTALGARFRSNA